VKGLTFEQNIQQIIQNQLECIRVSTEISMGVNPEDMFLSGEQLCSLFNSVRDQVINSQDDIGLHLYGLKMPIGFAKSDFGDYSVTISVTDEPFNTIEGIRNYLVEQLIGGNEVYVYTVNVVRTIDPHQLGEPQRRYYIRCALVHRSKWEQLTAQAETDRDLHEPSDMAQQINRWLEEKEKEEDGLTPKQRIKKHKF